MKRKLLCTLLPTACILAVANAAITIGFESGEGYSPGDLAGQPSSGTQWIRTNGSNNFINVAAGIGVGGTAGITGASGGGSNHTYYGLNTTNADLGFTFDSNSSILQYSFNWRVTTDFAEASVDIFRFVIGSDANAGGSGAAQLTIRSHGVFVAQNGGTAVAQTLTQAGLFTVNQYSTISGTVNYATNTYTVFVDGVQQFTDTNSGNLAFVNSASNNAYIRIGNLTGSSTDYRAWNLDNITVVPEPSTYAALLGLLALAWVGYRKRKAA